MSKAEARSRGGGHPDRLPDLSQEEMRKLLHEARRVKGERVAFGRVYLDKREGKVGVRTYNEE